MKRFLTYILLLFSLYANATYVCTNYVQTVIESTGGIVAVDTISDCEFSLTATPTNNYKFAYWTDQNGNKNYTNTISFSIGPIDTLYQNILYNSSFVKDNSFIYRWGNNTTIRTNTTDLLSEIDTVELLPGIAYTIVNNERLTVSNESITKLDWGVWKTSTIELLHNNEYAGQPVRMVFHNSCGKPSAVIDTIVPVVVKGTMSSDTMNFHSDVEHTDLQVLEDATLYINSNVTINGILDIHEGAKVVINEGYTLNTQGIILRGSGITQKWAQLIINGNINDLDSIFYDYTLTDSLYYPLSLPDNVEHSSVLSSITNTQIEDDVCIPYLYNTIKRHSQNNGWEALGNNPYIMGNGYIMWTHPHQWKNISQQNNIIRYPIHVDLSDELSTKSISINGCTDCVVDEWKKNWNLIGNPYLYNYVLNENSKIIEVLDDDESEIAYITYSVDGFRTYSQEQTTNNFILKPFNSYFIQTVGNGEIKFEKSNANYSPRRIRGYYNYDLRTGITLTQNNRTEHIGLLYGDYTDDYEINADLTKMFGNINVLYAYSLSENEQLAYQAVSIDNIYPIPVGYRNAKITTMTFAFDNEHYTSERLSGLWLHDSKLNQHVNLLYNDYTFTPILTNEDNRFYITAELHSSVATNIDNIEAENKYYIVDILGRRISETLTNGVYIIYKNGKYIKVMK